MPEAEQVTVTELFFKSTVGLLRRQRSSQLLSLKGQYFLLTGVLSDLNVCVDLLRKLGCPGTSLGSSLFPGL